MHKRSGWLLAVLVTTLAAAVAVGCGEQPVRITETGSTLLFPLFQLWVPAYQAQHPGVQITPNGTGSGAGISEAESGAAQIGASDAYMTDSQLAAAPGILNIPLAISAQQVNYNLPGLNGKSLNISGPILAGIYSGTIKYWDDPAIRQANPGVALPHHVIIPIHRTDGSGDSFIFTQYLSFSDPAWQKSVGYSVSPTWPAVPTAVGAVGNPGMVQACQQTPYSVAYIGISWLDQVKASGLGTFALANRAGRYVLPDTATISAAATAVATSSTHLRVSLVWAPGADSYPIINYEYAVVKQRQPSAALATAIRDFLSWAVSPQGGGSPAFLDKVHFLPLPPTVAAASQARIASIGGP